MLLLGFTFRHLRRHWRMNLAMLLGLTLAAALLSSLPNYASAIAARSLRHNLDNASPAMRNLLVTGNRATFSAGLFGRFEELLGDLIVSRMEIRETTVGADPVPPTEQIDGQGRIITTYDVFSFDKLPSSVRVVTGRLPNPADPRQATNQLKPPPIETVIGARTAEQTGLEIGDFVTSDQGFIRFDIVGIVEPLDPQSDIWAGDLSAFEIEVDTSNPNYDVIALRLIVSPASIQTIFSTGHEVFWRVVIDHARITPDNAGMVLAELVNLQTQLSSNRATISTGLVKILEGYLTNLSRVRMSLFLLTMQAFIFVLYSLTMLTSFMLDRSQVELATLSGRGATALQITAVFALQSLLLALLVAPLLGPGLAQGVMQGWAAVTGETVPSELPREAWLLSGVATALGWLALVLPVYPAARRNLLEWQRARARPTRLSTIQKLYLDLFLLVFGGLLYWQLNQSGSFVMRRVGTSSLADPLLLIGPSLLLVAVALVFLRVFPFLLWLAAWAFRRTRGLMLPMGLSRLARDPLKASRVVLLISLTAGLALFARSFDDSLKHGQVEMSHYTAGADLRVSLDQSALGSDQPAAQLTQLPGVLDAAPVLRATVQTEEGRGIHLFALDPATFARVARYPSGLTNLTIASLARVLQTSVTTDTMPAIFSHSAMPSRAVVGGETPLTLAGRPFSVQVRGTINNFPTLSGAFVVVNLADLGQQIDLTRLDARLYDSFEVWLNTDPARHDELVNRPELAGRILDDAQTHLRVLRDDPVAQGTGSAFRLSVLTLAGLSVAGFLLVHFINAQQRVVEFSVLRSMGLSARQLMSLLATEGLLVMALGLAAGTLIGYGMAQVMVPYLSRALSASLAGVTIGQTLIDWLAIARLYALLIGFYALAMVLLLLALTRVGIHRAMRIGDE